LLARHQRIDGQRIAVMGLSKGGVAALYSSNERFRNLYDPVKVKFAAHIGLYTPCNMRYRDDEKVTGAPIRLFQGIDDDSVSIAPCRDYIERLKRAGANATLTEYPSAYHAYDWAALSAPGMLQQVQTTLMQAQTTRNCTMREGDNGQVLNVETGAIYTLADSCVERGAHVGYNQAAHDATVKAVREFLTTTFKLSS
jgi:dienelactone hydrolase